MQAALNRFTATERRWKRNYVSHRVLGNLKDSMTQLRNKVLTDFINGAYGFKGSGIEEVSSCGIAVRAVLALSGSLCGRGCECG
jgi:hypothetical protein